MPIGPLKRFGQTGAGTGPEHEDPRLRGRVYGIPFDRVWTEALSLAGGGLPRWTLLRCDDQEGRIDAEAKRLVTRRVDDVEVRISLDADAQTRVDITARSRSKRGDLGANRRHILT